MSNADQVAVAMIKETTFGTAPSGSYLRMRITSESLAQTSSYIASNELREDRQITDQIRSEVGAGGTIDFELSYGGSGSAFDALLQYLMFSAAWSTEEENTGTFSSVSATKTFSGTGISAGFVVGQWVRARGFSAAVDGYYKIATIPDANSFTVVQTVAADVTGGGDEVVTMGSQLVNGTTLSTVAIEREFTDNTNDFAIHEGYGVQQFSLQTQANGIITGQFQFMGKTERSATASPGSGYTAAPTNEVMNAIDHVALILRNGASVDLSTISLQANNNLRGRTRIGEEGPFSLGAGKFNVTGSLEGYYDGPGRIDDFLDDTAGDAAIVFQDSAGTVGNAYIFDVPQMKLTSGTRNAQGTNQDVMDPVNFAAYMDPTEGITLRIVRFASVA